jgi:hypothetical protein
MLLAEDKNALGYATNTLIADNKFSVQWNLVHSSTIVFRDVMPRQIITYRINEFPPDARQCDVARILLKIAQTIYRALVGCFVTLSCEPSVIVQEFVALGIEVI